MDWKTVFQILLIVIVLIMGLCVALEVTRDGLITLEMKCIDNLTLQNATWLNQSQYNNCVNNITLEN